MLNSNGPLPNNGLKNVTGKHDPTHSFPGKCKLCNKCFILPVLFSADPGGRPNGGGHTSLLVPEQQALRSEGFPIRIRLLRLRVSTLLLIWKFRSEKNGKSVDRIFVVLSVLRHIHTEQKWKRNQNFSLMFVVYPFDLFTCFVIFFAFAPTFVWCE